MTRRQFGLVLAALAAYKAVEHLFVFGMGPWWRIGGPLLIGALLVQLRPRLGYLVIAVGVALILSTPAYRNHLHLLMLVALTLALFDDETTERWVLRWQLSVMYGFAATAKLNPEWLSGESLEGRTWVGELLPSALVIAVAVVTIIVEAGLAIGVWTRWRGWLAIAALTHAAFLLFTETDPWDRGRLLVFSALALATWLRAGAAVDPAPTSALARAR
jgi:uncharacterized membrane protein YphA (DoxX/SURF4 family)